MEESDFQASSATGSGSSYGIGGNAQMRRPPNSFMLFCMDRRTELRSLHPELPNVEISKILGTEWKNVDEKTKALYKDKAKMLQTTFKSENPNYKYEKARQKRTEQQNVVTPNRSTSHPPDIVNPQTFNFSSMGSSSDSFNRGGSSFYNSFNDHMFFSTNDMFDSARL